MNEKRRLDYRFDLYSAEADSMKILLQKENSSTNLTGL